MSALARTGLLSVCITLLAGCSGDGIFDDADDGDGGSGGSQSGTGGSGGTGGTSPLTFYSMDSGNRDLIRFQFGALNTPTRIPTSGISGTPLPLALDFRPADGVLYAVFNDKRVYRINKFNGSANMVATLTEVSGSIQGFDWNPVADAMRVLAGTVENYRYNANGSFAGQDTNLDYVTGDANDTATPGPQGVAYTGSSGGATTAYVIDGTQDVLARLGSVGGSPDSPNTGKLTTVGALGVNYGGASNFGFDIDRRTGIGYAIDRVSS